MMHWKDWCWSWNSNILATLWEELTHWKRPWCWEGLGSGGEGDDRGWDGWMASPTWWTWVWVNSGSWWWTGRPGMLRFMGSQRVRHDWATELNWLQCRVRVLYCLPISTSYISPKVIVFNLLSCLFYSVAFKILDPLSSTYSKRMTFNLELRHFFPCSFCSTTLTFFWIFHFPF